jgi:DNA modification methylase
LSGGKANDQERTALPTPLHASAHSNTSTRLDVQELRLASLRPWPDNPRKIRPQRLDDLKRALEADPAMLWARPLIALPDGTVICGNQRLLAARALGWETIPVLVVDLGPDRARLWALRDNAQYGDWDETALAGLLAELAADGVELALTGFATTDLDTLLAGIVAPVDPEEAPTLPDSEPVSRPGEVYELGRHRLACGDARDQELLHRLLGETRPVTVWTDPPYGIAYSGKTERALTIRNDDSGAGALLEQVLRRLDPLLAWDARFYVCCPAGPTGTEIRTTLLHVGWHLHQSLVWVKHKLVPGFSDYQFQHEDILYGWRASQPGREGKEARWYGGANQSSVFFVDRPARSHEHPTMKPVALIAGMLTNSSRRGEAVIDPFAGSGSTLIAAEQTGRRCFAVELDPRYCDVIRQRYEEYSHAG